MGDQSYAAGGGFPNPRAARRTWRAAFMTRGGDPRGGHRGGPWGEPFGFGYGGPRGGFRARHGKARRGDIRTAVLLLLAEEPRNGYSIMQELEQRSGGIWRPSPGSVYPALSQLEDEGVIRSEERDGRKVFVLTEAGREQLAQRPADAPAPWDTLVGGVSNEVRDVMGQLREVAAAAAMLARTAGEPQLAEAKKVLSEARRALYGILAGGEDDE